MEGLRCERWPDHFRLQSTLGALVPGRCRSVNLCSYCARLAAVETAEVLALDAMTNSAPALWSVTTTRTATLDMTSFRRGRDNVRRAVKRRWPDARAATMVEFQTGRGTNSGGKRRAHFNDMWKGIPAEDGAELHDVICGPWLRNVDATRKGQYVGTIEETGGLMRYLALHFQKQDQAPPKGWRGHRFRAMAGYLEQPMAEAREQARQSLRFKREVWKLRDSGLSAEQVNDLAERALHEANELAWELVRLQDVPTAFSDDGMPSAWETIIEPVR